jgi:RecA/RadA recombinase
MAVKKSFTIQDIAKRILEDESAIGEQGIVSQFNDEMPECISTGNYMLNMLLTANLYGGIPVNAMTVIAGEEQTAKTFLALNICREAQKKGYTPIWIDTEGAINPKVTFPRFGVDITNMIYYKEDMIEKITHFLGANLDEAMKVAAKGGDAGKYIIVVDSLGQVSSLKSRTDIVEGANKKDMTLQQKIGDFCKTVTTSASKLKWPVVVIGHIYTDPSPYGAGWKLAGGTKLKYSASNILILRKKALTEGTGKDRVKLGITVNASLFKARYTKDGTSIDMEISKERGMNPYSGMIRHIAGIDDAITYEDLGIGRGQFIDEEVPETDENGAAVVGRTGKPKMVLSGNKVFKMDKTGSNVAVAHLNRNVTMREFCSNIVWTDEMLQRFADLLAPRFLYSAYDPSKFTFDVTEEGLVIDDGSTIDSSTGEILDGDDDDLLSGGSVVNLGGEYKERRGTPPNWDEEN